MLFFVLTTIISAIQPMIIPHPAEMTVLDGQWILTSSDQIYYDSSVEGAQEVAEFCAQTLRKVTGYKLPLTTSVQTTGILFLKSPTDTNEEEYDVSVTSDCFKILASKRSGLFYGYQTLLQLLPIEVFSSSVQQSVSWKTPCVSIHDYPRLQWRGILVDVARHFFDIPTVKSIIDGMAVSKLNRIHMHLTDDQAWRIEIKKYPLLTEIGSIREQSPKMWDRDHLDGTPYGPYFYTQEEVKDLVSYAKKRGITIVPEIEMPGHGLSALAGYPQFSCTGGPFKPRCIWGVEEDVYCAGNDGTFKFLEDILDEVFELFDSEFVHCGGDECPKNRWKACPKCQQRKKDLGISSEDQLQSWFVQHFANYAKSKGHRLIGWDEILEGGLAEGAAVMSWRGVDGGQAAARQGHDVVMTPAYYLYLDYYQFPIQEKYEYNCLLSTLYRICNYDARAGISSEYQKYIIGVQGNAWAEFIWHTDDIQYKIFPRSCAVGETGWTQLGVKNWAKFAHDVTFGQIERIKKLGINCAPFSNQPEALWKAGEIPTQWVTVSWDISGSFNQGDRFGVIFLYSSGQNKLKTRNVKILVNNVVIATDNHEGVAFETPVNNVYSVSWWTKPAADAKIEIQAECMAVDGTDTNGKVYIYKE